MSSKLQVNTMTQEELVHVMIATSTLLKKWQLSTTQKAAILGIESLAALQCFEVSPEKMLLSGEQVLRLSMLMNIHASLRTLFQNPENIYGFMTKVNANPPFEGDMPINLAISNIHGLSKTHHALAAMIS